jgi:hypothetical protein
MASDQKKPRVMVTIKLTEKQARLVWQNADGWLDAGACKDGLTPDEDNALHRLSEQISAQIHGSSRRTESFREALRQDLIDSIEGAGFSWHSDDERKIIDAIMKVVG